MTLGLASRIFLSTICVLVFIIGTFINIGLLIVFLRSRELRNRVSSVYIISLLLAQIVACLYEVPYYFLSIALKLPAPPQEQYRNVCRISMFITFLLASLKILSLTVMSLDRYLAISFPFVYERFISKTKALSCVAYIWVQSLGYTIPLLVIKDWTNYEGACGYACGLMWGNADNVYVVLSSMTSIAIPCVIMAFTNIMVFLTARRQHLQISSERHKRFGKSSGDTRTTLRYQESHDLSQNAEIETNGLALRGNYGSMKGSCTNWSGLGKQSQQEQLHNDGKLGKYNQESMYAVNKKVHCKNDSMTSHLETIPENGALCKNECAKGVVTARGNCKEDFKDSKPLRSDSKNDLKSEQESHHSTEGLNVEDFKNRVSNFPDSCSNLKSKNESELTIDERSEKDIEIQKERSNAKEDIKDSKPKMVQDPPDLNESLYDEDVNNRVLNFRDSSSSPNSKSDKSNGIGDERREENIEIQNNQCKNKSCASNDSHCETVSEEIGRSTGEGDNDCEEEVGKIAKSTVSDGYVVETSVKEDDVPDLKISNAVAIDSQNDSKNKSSCVSEHKSPGYKNLKHNEGKNSNEGSERKSDRRLASSDQSSEVNSEEKSASSLKKRYGISRYLERRKRKRSLNSENSSSSQLSFHIITSTLLLVLTFFITYTPYLISRVMITFSLGKQAEEVIVYTALLTIIGNVVNPAIILGTRRKLRLDFMRLVCRKHT